MPKSAIGWSEGEEEVSPDLLAVRSMLRGLPKLECKAGFENRLQRKLAGGEAGVRAAGSTRAWTLGWAGAGLGFATALAIAFFAFDLTGPTPSTSSQMSGVTSPSKPIPAPVQVGTSRDNNEMAAPPAGVMEDKQVAKSQTQKDTLPPSSKVDIPENLIHTTGGQK